MTPFAAKILLAVMLFALYLIWRVVFKDTLKGESGASMILFVCLAPTAAMVGIFILVIIFKAAFYLIASSSLFQM